MFVSCPSQPIQEWLTTFVNGCGYKVPPIIISMINNKQICDKYDLSSVDAIFTGGAPLGRETAEDLQKQQPNWKIRQAYGKLHNPGCEYG